MWLHIYVHMWLHTYIHMWLHIYIHMCIHIYTYRHAHMSDVEKIYQYSLFHIELNETMGHDKPPKDEN